MSLVLLIVGITQSTAQIVLHEATDITQTKATLSADFPDINAEHGFQYKCGTLSEIDDFSRLALSSTSDPVQIYNNSSYPWVSRPTKGWIESNPNVPVGSESEIFIHITIYEPTNLSFDWRIDCEKDAGVLKLMVDGAEENRISETMDFNTVITRLSCGEHTIAISYQQLSYSNEGLGIGIIKNMKLFNTTPGQWNTITCLDSSVDVLDLAPDCHYIYRAFDSSDANFSPIFQFSTIAVSINQQISDITQTKAKAIIDVDCEDTNAGTSIIWGHMAAFDSQYQELFDSSSSFAYLNGGDGREYHPITLSFKTIFNSTISFDSRFSGGTAGHGYITIKSEEGYNLRETILSHSYNHHKYTYNIPPGTYNITFSSQHGTISVSEIKITSTTYGPLSNYLGKFEDEVSDGIYTFTNLRPSTPYAFFIQVNSNTSDTGIIAHSKLTKFTTQAIDVIANEDVLTTQTTAVVRGNINFGDAELYSCGIMHKDSQSSKWTYRELDQPLSQTVEKLLTRLKPFNQYDWRLYVVPNDCDTIYSPINIFATKPIVPQSPTILALSHASVDLDVHILYGDADVYQTGVEFMEKSDNIWKETKQNNNDSIFCARIENLKPNTTYMARSFVEPAGADMIYSDILQFCTLPIIVSKPQLLKITQHEVIVQGKIIFGDANIYQRGMQFRKKGVNNWTEVEDNGQDSIFIFENKNLELGTKYEIRTYVQPAECDILYSEILEFTTLDTYFLNSNANTHTQTSVTLEATLVDTDDDASINYGFEYYIASDGSFENAVTSDVIDIPVTPDGKELKTVITGLAPYMGIRWRAYAIVDGNKVYYTSSKNLTWDFAETDRATIVATINNITQTSISLELDAIQEGDAIVSQIEYALANSVQDTQDYSICGNTLTLNNLIPNQQYNIRFRGLVNERYCPLLKEISRDYSWFEYKTLPVNVNVSFSGITQTKAKMKVSFDSGDAEITDIRYRLNYDEILPYSGEQNLINLIPGSSYSVTVFAKVNGEESSWNADSSNNAFKFTTKGVYTNVSVLESHQTAAKISWTSNVGDATFVCSGLEFSGENVISDSESGERTFNELIPNRSYSCRSYVETAEGGRVYSAQRSFTTKAITTATLNVTNISNRSAALNGEIDCDSYSSAEFGFQWKQMEGWQSAPAFTKGVKREDGEISVSLVNGMLEPNTDYQYRTAVRYLDEIYTSNDWKTFRTESEFIYYPATVYTVFRTDRENNALILCGYYIAGSETIISQGYEYWQVGQQSSRAYAPQNAVTITTDESMQHTFLSGELANGNYAVRAFVKTETGDVLYGATLGFNVSENGYSSIDTVGSDDVNIFAENSTLKVLNGHSLSCFIYDISGILIAERNNMSDYEEFSLAVNSIYIVKLSNGKVMKIRL